MKSSKILKVLVVSSALLITGGALAGCSDDDDVFDCSSKFDGLPNINTVSKGVYKLASLPESNITGKTAAIDDNYHPNETFSIVKDGKIKEYYVNSAYVTERVSLRYADTPTMKVTSNGVIVHRPPFTQYVQPDVKGKVVSKE